MTRRLKTLLTIGVSFVVLTAAGCNMNNKANAAKNETTITAPDGDEYIKHITTDYFKQNIFDYVASPSEFVYKGNVPAIIDFYADWCGPCRQLSPKLEEVAKKYKGKVMVYKINIDNETELARIFSVRSIPMCLFVPVKGTPIQTMGNLPMEEIEKTLAKVMK